MLKTAFKTSRFMNFPTHQSIQLDYPLAISKVVVIKTFCIDSKTDVWIENIIYPSSYTFESIKFFYIATRLKKHFEPLIHT